VSNDRFRSTASARPMPRRSRLLHAPRYEVTFVSGDGTERRVAFRVAEHRGVPAVRPWAGRFVTGEADAREVAAAVLGFHRAQRGW